MQKKSGDALQRVGLKLVLVLFDIFAVNFAYYISLFIRFYVNYEFHSSAAYYFPAFYRFAPYYTVCCIVIFWLFKLYNGMWKYAGWNDMNRVVFASLSTCAVQILGTLLFVRRMPISYYAIGAFIQFLLIAVSRFSYRVVMIELAKYVKDKNAAYVNVMIVGAGENARTVLRQFDEVSKSLARPVCLIDYHNQNAGRFFDGLPVIGGLDEIPAAIEKYQVKSAVLADSLMPEETRDRVHTICQQYHVDVQDFFPFAQTAGKGVSFRKLLECAYGPVAVTLNGVTRQFDNSEQAAGEFTGKYRVRSVSAEQDRLQIVLEVDLTVLNNMNEPWVRDYEAETGEQVSFF